MLKKITAFFTSVLISIIGIFIPPVPKPRTVEELQQIPNFYQKFEIGEEVYVIDSQFLDTTDKMHMAICLQGIVAKTKPCIYIKTNETDNYYINEIKNNGAQIIYNDENGIP